MCVYSLRSVSVIAGVLGRAGEAGQKRRLADAAHGICTWRNPEDIRTWIAENKPKMDEEEKAEKEALQEQAKKQAPGQFRAVESDPVTSAIEQLKV